MWTSSNPVLAKDDKFKEIFGTATKSDVATVQGIVNKTTILVLIAVVAGGLAYAYIPVSTSTMMISWIAAMGICFGMGIVMCGNPKISPVMAPIYAVVQGIFLGLFTALLDKWLGQIEATRAVTSGATAAGAERVSLAMPAFLITISVTLAMLGLYSARIIRPTERFKAVLGTLVAGVFITYALSWVLAMFGVSIPFLRLSSTMEGGMAPLIGLGISLLILGIASLCLIVDFGRAEAIVKSGAPKYMEWYAGFALLVTLAWIYYEAVKLAFRLYLLFGDRD